MNYIEMQKEVELRLSVITDSWKQEARTILCHVLKCDPIDLVLSKDKPVEEMAVTAIRELLDLRVMRVPLQYGLGYQHFYGLSFKVNASVLIPRPETECLVDFIIREVGSASLSILDIGVGSGAIVVSLAHHLKACTFVASDISEEALDVAKENAWTHGVADRISWIKSDLFGEIQGTCFDMIVSNPPYIPNSDAKSLAPEVYDFEPHLALFGGNDGLDLYRRIIPEAKAFLNPGGWLIFEAGHDQKDAIISIFNANGYVQVGTFSDLNNVPRFIYGKKAPTEGEK